MKKSVAAAHKLRVLALFHHSLVPPEDATEKEARPSEWKTEFDVMRALRNLGHEVMPLGVGGDLGAIRKAVEEFKPDIAFNLLEGFDDVPIWDQNIVALPGAAEDPLHRLQLARHAAVARQGDREEAALLPPHPGRGLRRVPGRARRCAGPSGSPSR